MFDFLRISTSCHSAIRMFSKNIHTFQGKHSVKRLEVLNETQEPKFETSHAGIFVKSENAELFQKKIHSFKLDLFASEGYIAKFGAPKSISELKNHKLVSYYDKGNNFYGSESFNWHVKVSGKETPDTLINIPRSAAHCAKHDGGIIILVNGLSSDYMAKRFGFRQIQLEESPAAVDIYFMCKKEEADSELMIGVCSFFEKLYLLTKDLTGANINADELIS